MRSILSAIILLGPAIMFACSDSSKTPLKDESHLENSRTVKVTTQHYIGESVTTSKGVDTRHPYLLLRTVNPESKTIDEQVVSFDSRSNKFLEFNSQLHITGNHAVMTESTGTVSGDGELTGAPWQWDFFKAEFKVAGQPMRIVDFNIFAPMRLIGHKDFYIKNLSNGEESLFRQEDVILNVVSESEFTSKRSELLNLK